MKGAFITLIINSFATALILFRNDVSPSFKTVLFSVFFTFLILSFAGTVLYSIKKKTAYAVIAMTGFGFFLPSGAIGVYSIRKLMDKNISGQNKSGYYSAA